MKTKIIFLIAMLSFSGYAFSTTHIVDKNGGGQFTSIQTAITNSTTNDTIKVWPGQYNEQINLNKNIIIMGSGYENTIIFGTYNPTITMNDGIIQWFGISSQGGNGVNMNGGIIRNCVIEGCSGIGIFSTSPNTPGSTSYIQNCIIKDNTGNGVQAAGYGTLIITNCISRGNSNTGFVINDNANINLKYCNGSTYDNSWGSITQQNVIDADPLYTSVQNHDYHIGTGSLCFNSGDPFLFDPDGSISDMGYFGGPNCPIYPVVFEIKISPNGNNINLQAKGRANY